MPINNAPDITAFQDCFDKLPSETDRFVAFGDGFVDAQVITVTSVCGWHFIGSPFLWGCSEGNKKPSRVTP